MKSCCENKDETLSRLKQKQSKVLKIVFFINFIMFFVEFISGLRSESTALMGDSLDMLGDSFVYGFSLYVIAKSDIWRVRSAQIKGSLMLLFGLIVLGQAVYKIITGEIPAYHTMGYVAFIALIANLVCLWFLYSHRDDDINMRSTWICSRNDIVSNSGTILAAFLVGRFQTIWPDVIIGVTIASLFLKSSFSVLKDSFALKQEIKYGS